MPPLHLQTDRHIIYKKGTVSLKTAPNGENSNSISEREHRCRGTARKWHVQSGPKSLREGVGENGAKWVRVGTVDTGLAFDRAMKTSNQFRTEITSAHTSIA